MLTRRLAAGLVIILTLLGAACGDDDPSADTATTTAAAEPTEAPAATTVPEPTEAPAATTAPEPTDAPPMTTAGPGVEIGDEVDQVVEIDVVDGQVVDGPHTEEVALGSTVALVVTSDVDDEVHVHVYDIHGEARAGQTTATTFVADIPGVVEVELENAGRLLVELEVS